MALPPLELAAGILVMVFLATQGRVVCKPDVIFTSNVGQLGFLGVLEVETLPRVWQQIGDGDATPISAQSRAAKIQVLILQGRTVALDRTEKHWWRIAISQKAQPGVAVVAAFNFLERRHVQDLDSSYCTARQGVAGGLGAVKPISRCGEPRYKFS